MIEVLSKVIEQTPYHKTSDGGKFAETLKKYTHAGREFARSLKDDANAGRDFAAILKDGRRIDNAENIGLKREFNSTYEERFKETPENGEKGHWTGERGESKYIPANDKLRKELAEHGVDGIEYKNAVPDFSPVAEEIVEIDKMSGTRRGPGGNFEQADQKCADKWNSEQKDGRANWTARDVEDYRKNNKLTWHEHNDMKTCLLVSRTIHTRSYGSPFTHFGGVGECNKANHKEKKYDE